MRLRRDVISKILRRGWVDAVKKFHSGFQYSVPTHFNKDDMHFTKLRLDYFFLSPDLTNSLERAEIIRTPETHQLSDHFPVVIELDFDK